MQLISLKANKPSFKTVNFKNETGLNFIVASQVTSSASKKDDSRTTNGVGKSLIISLIHFCLGSNQNKELKSKLEDWIFSLSFKIGDKVYTSVRETKKQNIINLNGEDLKLKDFKSVLQDLLFNIPDNIDHLTFRSLIPFFIRPSKASYYIFNNPNAVKNDYQIQVCNAFLLGLDIQLVQNKYELRKEEERVRKLINELKKDKLMKEFFDNNKDSSIELQQIKTDIENLQFKLSTFEVADDYYEVNAEADRLKNDLDTISNKIYLFNDQISRIEESSKITPDISKQKIVDIYNESSVLIKDNILKTLDELEKFYTDLAIGRKRRLFEEKQKLKAEIENLKSISIEKEKQLDAKLQYLDAKKALDVYVSMNKRLADLRLKEKSIKRFDELISKYDESQISIKKQFISATEDAKEYLESATDIINYLSDFFRELSKRFYPDSPAGISISNNSGDNQIRFDIDAKISSDASDGINNIKILCYDLTLLLKGAFHNVDFIFHDSRLLSDTDPRQVASLFKVLNDYIKISGKQYNLSLNQNQLNEVKKYLSEEEYKTIVQDNICLELKDESPKDKLLGVQIDMNL
ncbi:MAG: DUF2326 domain-containing protein [Marinifilaceae bacterium]|jgi:uncharacterized protein YydD (DUF2326 family)|nr:DUF2326 domain-containing protein [Marinifilaceae bacterium]